MENHPKDKEIITHLIERQLNDPDKIRMADGTTFAYRFSLSAEEASALGLPESVRSADILLDLMMEFMQVIGLDENGTEIAKGAYPEEVKGPYIRRIFELYGQKAKTEKQAGKTAGADEGNQPLTAYLKSETRKQIRRFYLNYPVLDKEGKEIHLYIETEVDEDDASYVNYWVGCEEYTAKRYIASCQADIEAPDPLSVVQVKHLYFYIDEILKA